ncbi:hypothetical protein KCU89_g14893, partial [Aureobasidium melanogenum]
DLLYLLVGLSAYHGRENETRRQTSPGSSAGTVVASHWSIVYPADVHLDADMSRYHHYHYLPLWIHYKCRWKRHLYWLHNHHYVNVELAVIFLLLLLLLLLSIKRKFLKFEQQQFQRQFLPFVFKQQQRIVVKQFECFILNKQYRCPDYRLLIQFVQFTILKQLKFGVLEFIFISFIIRKQYRWSNHCIGLLIFIELNFEQFQQLSI